MFAGKTLYAQTAWPDEPVIGAFGCEENSALVDKFKIDAWNNSDPSFIVFRPGDREGPGVLNHRFSEVSAFLRVRKGLARENFIYARGEKVSGLGRIEFYTGGKLRLVILSKRELPCMDCCDDWRVLPAKRHKTQTRKTRGS
jgi:hypothetical protein